MANRLCRYTSNYIVKAMDCSSTLSINVDRAGDTGQDVWVYQKLYNSSEGFVINYQGESTYSEWVSQLSELIDKIGRTDLGITKIALDAHEANLNVLSTLITTNFNVMSSQFSNAQTIQNVMITKIDHTNDNFLDLTSAINTNSTKIVNYMNLAGIGKFNCTPVQVFNSIGTTFQFNDASSALIASYISNTARVYINGLRTTAYTENSTGGSVVFTVAPSSVDRCVADFQVYSTDLPLEYSSTNLWDVSMSSSDYTEFTSTGIISIATTDWSTYSDTGWLPTT